MRARTARATVFLLAGSLAGCAAGAITGPVDLSSDVVKLPMPLQDGSTRREDVLLQLGPPSAQFEGERIFTYRLRREGERLHPVPPIADPGEPRYSTWVNADHNLILVFDDRNVLRRHSLLRIK